MKWLKRILTVCWWLAVVSVLWRIWGDVSYTEYAVILFLTVDAALWDHERWRRARRRERAAELRDLLRSAS